MATGRIYYYEKRGVYQAIVENGRDAQGKRVQIFRDAKTKKEARQILQKLLRELDDGTFIAPSDLIVAEHLESWLTDVVRHQVGGALTIATRASCASTSYRASAPPSCPPCAPTRCSAATRTC